MPAINSSSCNMEILHIGSLAATNNLRLNLTSNEVKYYNKTSSVSWTQRHDKPALTGAHYPTPPTKKQKQNKNNKPLTISDNITQELR